MKKSLAQKSEELELLQQKTEKQFRLQQNFITMLSQELRTPLYGIMGLTNLLAEEQPELKDNKRLKSLKFSGDYLLTLINNVLNVNIIDNKEVIAKSVVFDLKEVVQNLLNSFSYATESSDNKLHFEFDPEIENNIKGDPAILSQILMNLVNNALRFTKNGNIYFSVGLVKKQNGISNISFKISHDGDEISDEAESSIYREFINIEKAKKSYLGKGINSKIVNRLARAINAEIIVENNSRVGSQYTILVDLESAEEITDVKEGNPNLSDKVPSSSTSRLKALIVDDNKLNLLVADKMLSQENFDCTTIDNGFDAIDLAKDNDYDIILMDINMPKLNGIGTTKRIREFDTKTPIIALTGVDITQLNRQIVQAGLNDYLLKPYNKITLLEMINKYLNIASAI
ncbi:response regulator [Aquimarina pacifica]|uniref:response regulator n=1 Tax=Aquimarina pacifica TaxID=1296415 RepID=UPI0013764E9F|nr:response regulator [Aquimarina pacifica]